MSLTVHAAEAVTAVGLSASASAAAVRAGISGLRESPTYWDIAGKPITSAQIHADADATASERVALAATRCLESLLAGCADTLQSASRIHLLLGAAVADRPGPAYAERSLIRLADQLSRYGELGGARCVAKGNAAFPNCLASTRELLRGHPTDVCIVGGIDSLLDEATLDWFEGMGRLKSETFGRNQGLSAGEGVAFLALGSGSALGKPSDPCTVAGLGLAEEPAPLLREPPSKAEGLTHAIRAALLDAKIDGARLDSVMGDMDGEHFRAKEFSLASVRCLGTSDSSELWNPADCLGSLGAATGAVYAALVVAARGWLPGRTLVCCSDDAGSRGAFVLARGNT